LNCPRHHRALHPFPTRRSSDLAPPTTAGVGMTSPGVSKRHCCSPVSGSRLSTPLSPVPRISSGWVGSKKRLPNPTKIRPPLLRRSEEHTSELQSRFDLVCRLLL